MKKVQTLALALALVALGSVSWAATSLNSSRRMQKGSPETTASNLNLSKSNINRLTGKVTQVDEKDKTFAVEVNFSAKEMKTLPALGEVIDVTYTETPGGPMATPNCCVKSSKSNGSERLVSGRYGLTGKVTKVNPKNNTFAVEVTVSAKNLKAPLPEVGKIIDVTFTQPTPGGPLEATTINNSKSNNL